MDQSMTEQAGVAFVDALAETLVARLDDEPLLSSFVEELAGHYKKLRNLGDWPAFDHPTMAHLEPLLASASGPPALVSAARAIAADLEWYQIFGGAGGFRPELYEGMLAGQVIGRRGLFESDRLLSGMFLLAPGIAYPPHTHASNEVYFCLSGELSLRHGLVNPPVRLAPGECSLTPLNDVHSLATGAAPVLLAYIWICDMVSANWAWEEDDAGDWHRVQWLRQEDASWMSVAREPVPHAQFNRALS